MPKEIFDQERPRSTMARRLDEAFAGCDQWTPAPPSQRRSEVGFKPRLYDATAMLSGPDAEGQQSQAA